MPENAGSETIHTPLTKLLGIKYPVLLAGMSGAAHADLVAAVTNAGGLGSIGGLTMTPDFMRREIAATKEAIKDKVNPKFGVDLAIPQIGGGARKTNHDYTHGHLDELIDIMIEEKASLFICAIGIPPRHIVEKLHKAGIPVMNMVGHPHHADRALDVGVDIICAQGYEGGGHTGEIASGVLLPGVVDRVRGRTSPLTGEQVIVVGAGGIVDGRGLAAALGYGCSGAWVGTRFLATPEASVSNRHKEFLVKAGHSDTVRTLIYSGRPVRCYMTDYVEDWEKNRAREIADLCEAGTVPFEIDSKKEGFSIAKSFPMLMGQAAGNVKEIMSAEEVMQDIVGGAIKILRQNATLVGQVSAGAVAGAGTSKL